MLAGEAGQRGLRGWLVERGADPGDEGQADDGGQRAGEDEGDEGSAAQQVGGDDEPAPREAVGERAEQRPQRDRREQLGEQDRADRPRRPRQVVGDEQQRDVADRVADRGLKRRRQEGSHATGCSEERSHVGPSLGSRRLDQ